MPSNPVNDEPIHLNLDTSLDVGFHAIAELGDQGLEILDGAQVNVGGVVRLYSVLIRC